jgi:DNA-binding beta-propeller fold protein YncE
MRRDAQVRLLSFGLLLLFGVFLSCSIAQTAKANVRQPMLIVVNKGDRTIGIVNPADDQQVVVVIATNGDRPHEATVSPDGRTAYVPIYGNSGVGKPGTDGDHMVVIDLGSRKIIGNLNFGHGVRPHCPVFDMKHNLVYVTTELDHSISIVDPRTLKIAGAVPTGQAESHMLAISSDGNRGYTANVGPGTVSVLDMRRRKVIKVIPISGVTQRISISPDDRIVFTSDQTKPQLAVIDTSTNKIKTWVPLPDVGYGTASTRNGRWLLVAIPAADTVAVVDMRDLKVVRTIHVCDAPQEILVQPDNPKIAYVSCGSTHNVAVLNLSNWKMQKTIDVGNSPDGLAWASAR